MKKKEEYWTILEIYTVIIENICIWSIFPTKYPFFLSNFPLSKIQFPRNCAINSLSINTTIERRTKHRSIEENRLSSSLSYRFNKKRNEEKRETLEAEADFRMSETGKTAEAGMKRPVNNGALKWLKSCETIREAPRNWQMPSKF